MDRKPVYLVMVSKNNNNKYYKMIPKGDIFEVEYGRVGVTCQKTSYPMSQWDKKYKEKLKKKYKDQSHLIKELIQEEKPKTDSEYKDIENKIIRDIVNKLQSMAKKSIQKNYKVGSEQVTQAMVDNAQAKIDSIMLNADSYTISKFNDELIELFSIIPRKMKNVSEYLSKTTDDFSKIIAREQDLLDVMKGQVVQHNIDAVNNENKTSNNESDKTILDAMNLVFEEVSDDEVSHIKDMLDEHRDKFKNAWKVTNLITQEKFDNFVKNENITEIKELWHGSRNENWWSIIKTGLVLRPINVVITGKMFGIGSYFATKAKKSLNYTSLRGSYWTGGTENNGYMAIMQVAYGKPYDVYSFNSKYYNFNYEKLQQACKGANSLHAHAGSMLKNDEIIIYKEEQCTIKYLVELGN